MATYLISKVILYSVINHILFESSHQQGRALSGIIAMTLIISLLPVLPANIKPACTPPEVQSTTLSDHKHWNHSQP